MEKYSVDRWNSDAFSSKEIAKKIENDLKNNLKILPHPFNGWRSEPNQNLETIKINENGLRSKSLYNLRFDKNAFLLGGSTAWGFGASNNEFTPAYLIENYLNKNHNINFNFINLADQMFSSYEELIAFVNNVELLKPELVIFISGCNDINREINESYKKTELHEKVLNFSYWGKKIGILDEKSYLKKILKNVVGGFKNISPIFEDYYLLKKPKKDEIASTLISEKYNFVNSYCRYKNIKCFHFLQPDLHFKLNKSEFEKKYLQFHFSKEKSDFLIRKFKHIEERFYKIKVEGIFFESLLNIFENDSSSKFFDRAHLTDKGYMKLSEFISKKIVKSFE